MNTVLDAGFSERTLSARRGFSSDPAPDVLAALFDELSHGIVVLDEHRRVLQSNEVARRELAHSPVMYLGNGELHASSAADGKLLQAALSTAGFGKRSLLNLGANGTELSLAVVPLKARTQSHSAGNQVALVFFRAGLCDSGMFDVFARSHRLTPTEEQVLVLLCRGLSTPEVASQMSVAVSTIRSHVRSLCAKTSSSGARELVATVAALPPVGNVPRLHVH